MITDLAGFSEWCVGLFKCTPNLEYVSFDHSFGEFLTKELVKTNQSSKSWRHLGELSATPLPVERHTVEEANNGFRTRKDRWPA